MADKVQQPTLFYSWQSDHTTTRSYIEKALKKALESIASSIEVEDAPRLDKDTQGEVGAVSIASTIKRKINKSKIFVADVSLIDKGQKGKKLVNQNVMFELGYAFGKKTEKAVILIANKDLGDAKELPFDIAQNRVIFCSPRDDPKAEKLVDTLEYAIRAHLGFIDEEQSIESILNKKEQLLGAIEQSKPAITKAESYFEDLFERYNQVAPARFKQGDTTEGYGEQVADAYQKSLPITVELYDVINVAAEYGSVEAITIGYKMLGELSAMYDNQPGENGKFEVSNEYYSLVIQEIASVIIGLLAKYKQWELIGELIPLEFIKPKNGTKKYSVGATYHLPRCVGEYYNRKTGQNYAIPTTPLIQERFIDNDKILRAYVSGVIILMFALKWYYPLIAGLLLSEREDYIPDFISELKSKAFADKFRVALSLNSIEELRLRLDEKRQQQLSDGFAYWNRDLTFVFNDAGLLPIENVGSN